MFKVRVNRIESYKDADGQFAKRIELVQDIEVPMMKPTTEEARIVSDVMQAMQQTLRMPPGMMPTSLTLPKMYLFLSEAECEELGIIFDVNQIYEITLENQTIKFKKSGEERDE